MTAKDFFAYLAVVLLALVIGFAPLALGGHPIPSIHDEFSYLLAADTFAHGRLTNPPLPNAEYFQTFHVLASPTYASKYPPGQGLILAAGQICGDPLYGVIVTNALACGAVIWMARGWLPMRFAVFAGLLATLHPLIRYWPQSYWGGSLGMLGGALVGGAVLRAARHPRASAAIALALGIGILINMRPLEGTIFTMLCGVYLLVEWWRTNQDISRAGRFIGISLLAFSPLLAWTGYYNYRVTGSALRTPYLLYAERFQGVPSLFGQKPWPNYEINPRMAWFRDTGDGSEYRSQLTWRGYFHSAGKKVYALVTQIIDWVRVPMLIPLLWIWRSRKVRWAIALTVLPVCIHLLITPWLRWHYLSPIFAAYFLLLALGARQLSTSRVGRIVLGGVVVWGAWQIIGLDRVEASTTHPPGYARAHLVDELTKLPGKHVVIVTYAPGPQQVFEWVFNDADLNAERVVFAFDRGPKTLADLMTLFPDHQFWSLKVADTQFSIEPIQRNR